jgi:hypothetical protein
LEIWNKISNSIIHGGRKPREPFPVPDEKPPQRPIEPQKDYLGLRINQLYLRDQRQWFTTIDPAVYASTEFLYGGGMRNSAQSSGLPAASASRPRITARSTRPRRRSPRP